MFAAVGSVYANMFNFSGRARRAEYWWYFLFVFIINIIAQGGLIYWLMTHPGIHRSPSEAKRRCRPSSSSTKTDAALVRVHLRRHLFLYWIPLPGRDGASAA
jgi:hypothetical protein